MSTTALRQPIELVRDLGIYAIAFGAIAVRLPATLVRNPLFLAPTLALVALKLFGGLGFSWWAATAPTWAMLAVYGGYCLNRNGRMQAERDRDRDRALVAAATGSTMGVFRRKADGRREDGPVYVGTSEACIRYVHERCATAEAAARLFVVQAIS